MSNININLSPTAMFPQLSMSPMPPLPIGSVGGQGPAALPGPGHGTAGNLMPILGDILKFILPMLLAM